MPMTDIIDRLKEACNGHPAAKIPWPHTLLHNAIAEIERLRDELEGCRAAFRAATSKQDWKPELTPAKLRALAHVAKAGNTACIECRGPMLTSCYALSLMGLVKSVGRRGCYTITPAGRKALADPDSFVPFAV